MAEVADPPAGAPGLPRQLGAEHRRPPPPSAAAGSRGSAAGCSCRRRWGRSPTSVSPAGELDRDVAQHRPLVVVAAQPAQTTAGMSAAASRPAVDVSSALSIARKDRGPQRPPRSYSGVWAEIAIALALLGLASSATERRAPVAGEARIEWRDSIAVGAPEAGSLVRGVRLPAQGRFHFTWDPVLRRSPDRDWRRWGTDDLVRTTLRVLREFRRRHPRAPRVGVGDLSLPEGGYFGPEVGGGIGHATHQNGLDVDVYYPRLDRRERPPDAPTGRPAARAGAGRPVRRRRRGDRLRRTKPAADRPGGGRHPLGKPRQSPARPDLALTPAQRPLRSVRAPTLASGTSPSRRAFSRPPLRP